MCSQIQEGEGNKVFKEARKESCTTWFKEEIGILDGIWKICAIVITFVSKDGCKYNEYNSET